MWMVKLYCASITPYEGETATSEWLEHLTWKTKTIFYTANRS